MYAWPFLKKAMDLCFKLRNKKFTHTSKEQQAQIQTTLGENDRIYLEDPFEYLRLYRKLLNKFGDVIYSHGTVGAMVIGCAQAQSPTSGCHPLCADALPYPIETENQNSHCMPHRYYQRNHHERIFLHLLPDEPG